MEESLFSFAYSVSFLDPESSLKTSKSVGSVRRRTTFLEAPGQTLACGVLTCLSCWGRQVERLAGLSATSTAVVAPQSPVCVPDLWGSHSPAVQQGSHLEESLCGGGLRMFLWIGSGPFQDSGGDSGVMWQTHDRHIAWLKPLEVPIWLTEKCDLI